MLSDNEDAAFIKLHDALERMRRHAKDVIDPPEGESMPYLIQTMMDDAHEILDLAHEFKAKVNAKER